MLTHSELNAAQQRHAARAAPGSLIRQTVSLPRPIAAKIAADAAAAHCTPAQMLREYVLRGALVTQLDPANLGVTYGNDEA